MTHTVQGNRNYAITVIKVPELEKAEGSDRLFILRKLGMTSMVDTSWADRVGELALMIPAETQLEHDLASANNLYRHGHLNKDEGKAGYLEDNARLRAIKLRGVVSNALVLPLPEAIAYLGLGDAGLKEGDVFDTLYGVRVCRKYVIEEKQVQPTRAERQVKKAFRRVDSTYLPEHFETGQWMREQHTVHEDAELIITQKLHGTSVRLANTVVRRQLTWLEKIAQKLGVAVKEYEYDLVAGSRRSIKDPNNPNQAHFYSSDIWTHALERFGDRIPQNHVIYGELVGFQPDTDKPIQKGHTYDQQPGEYELYVYRVAIVTESGDMVDLSWSQVRAFCERAGLKNVPELTREKKAYFCIEDYEEVDFHRDHFMSVQMIGKLGGYNQEPVRLSEGGTGADEGIAIRVESGLVPDLYKFKNGSHYLYETNQLDSGEADLESQG